MCLRGLSRGVGSAQLPLASSIRKRLIGPTWGVNSRIPVSAMDLHFFFEISLQPKKELQGSSKHSKMPKNQPDQMAGTLQKQVLPGSHIGFAERPFFLGLAPGHLEKFRFQRHPAIETHCLARTGWGSNPREK